MDRRNFLARMGAVGALGALVGCQRLTGAGRPADAPTPTATATGSGTATATGTPTPRPDDDDRPVIFNSPAKIAAIRSKVEAGEDPWTSAFDELRRDADGALDASPRSVVDNGAPAGTDDPHKYGSDAPYQGKDGVFSDDIDRQDYQAALDMKDWIRNTAQAYAVTGEDRYARKSIDLLAAWFLNPETRMFPAVDNFGPHTAGRKGQNSIEHYIFVPAMIYGAALVSGHPYWEATDGASEADLRAWVEAFQKTLETGAHGGIEGDEISKWWVTTRLLVAAYLGDMDAMEAACADWRTTALRDFEPRGTFEYARHRTRGLYYSLSAMNALTLGAEIASHYDVDLYGYALDGTSTSVLEQSHRYHADLLGNPSEWRWQERDGLDDSEREYGTTSYELCYSRRQTDGYRDAIAATGRPVYDQRVLGWVSLTHGNLFELDY